MPPCMAMPHCLELESSDFERMVTHWCTSKIFQNYMSGTEVMSIKLGGFHVGTFSLGCTVRKGL